jgi:general secretion pathway protein M
MSLKPNKPVATTLLALRQRWQTLSPREQSLLRWGAVLLTAAVVWWLALAPALQTVRDAPAQQAALDAQWQELKDLQAQAQSLQQQPRMSQAEMLRALQNSTTEWLGSGAQLQTVGERSTVTLKAVPAPALASWLAQVRTQARATPVQAHLERSAAVDRVTSESEAKVSKPASAQATGTPSSMTWSGSVVLSLPAP